jgi:hypothetical protein
MSRSFPSKLWSTNVFPLIRPQHPMWSSIPTFAPEAARAATAARAARAALINTTMAAAKAALINTTMAAAMAALINTTMAAAAFSRDTVPKIWRPARSPPPTVRRPPPPMVRRPPMLTVPRPLASLSHMETVKQRLRCWIMWLVIHFVNRVRVWPPTTLASKVNLK